MYEDPEQARKNFQRARDAALADPEFVSSLRESNLSLRFSGTDPEFEFLVSAGDEAAAAPGLAAMRFELSAQTAHEMLLGRLPLLLAVVSGRLVVKGPVAKIILLPGLLSILGREYADVIKEERAA